MEYYALRPEVAGDFGDHAVLDTRVHPPVVQHLHFEFADWFGDDLVCTFPVYLVSQRLAEKLASSGLRAFVLQEAEITLSPEAEEILEGQELPTFLWWQVTGQAGVDDFGLTDKAVLVVSERGLDVLRDGGRLEICEIMPYDEQKVPNAD